MIGFAYGFIVALGLSFIRVKHTVLIDINIFRLDDYFIIKKNTLAESGFIEICSIVCFQSDSIAWLKEVQLNK